MCEIGSYKYCEIIVRPEFETKKTEIEIGRNWLGRRKFKTQYESSPTGKLQIVARSVDKAYIYGEVMLLEEYLKGLEKNHLDEPSLVEETYTLLKQVPGLILQHFKTLENNLKNLSAIDVTLAHRELDARLKEETNDTAMIGKIIHGYRIRQVLGEGGFGTVYLAESETGKKKVLKIPRTPEAIASLKKEVTVQKRLQHPNIIDIEHIDADANPPYLLINYIEGAKNLDERQLNVEQGKKVLHQIVKGLAHAHDNGIVHGDLKPQNILVTDSLEVKICDFGLSCIARQASAESIVLSGSLQEEKIKIKGTLQYMSPEQRAGEKVTPASDIYALSLIAFKMFVGRLPEPGEAIQHPLKNKNVPEQIITLIQDGLSHDSAQRPKIHDYIKFFEPKSEIKTEPAKSIQEAPAKREEKLLLEE